MNRKITYRGAAHGLGMLIHMLGEEGVEAQYAPQSERRGTGDVMEVIVIYLTMKALDKATDEAMDAAAKRALAKFRKRARGNASVDDD